MSILKIILITIIVAVSLNAKCDKILTTQPNDGLSMNASKYLYGTYKRLKKNRVNMVKEIPYGTIFKKHYDYSIKKANEYCKSGESVYNLKITQNFDLNKIYFITSMTIGETYQGQQKSERVTNEVFNFDDKEE